MGTRKSAELRKIADDFIKTRKNANNLFTLLESLKDRDNGHAAILAVELVFLDVIQKREMKQCEGKENSENHYYKWLLGCYNAALLKLTDLVEVGETIVQEQALVTFMKLIIEEKKQSANEYQILEKLEVFIFGLLSTERNSNILISRIQEYVVTHGELAEDFWKIASSVAPKQKFPSHLFISNFLQLIAILPLSAQDMSIEGNANIIWRKKVIKKCVNTIWNAIIKWKHSTQTHKQMLLLLLQKLLPQIQKPLLLTDYLMSCLDSGGAISMLALQGVFILIQNHNLEYPNIYNKLYNMFDEKMFYTNYKIRFYNLSDMFLRSTYLPINLVAAFIKRLSRLALVAPPPDVHVLLSFVGNLLVRHPTLQDMMNHPVGKEVIGDPFNNKEAVPSESNAMRSSLWEVKSLQRHVIPNIAMAASFIDKDLPSIEWDFSAHEDTLDEMFNKEVKRKKTKEPSLTFERPASLALPRNEKLSSYWKLF